jgi:hypothetical protein
MFLQKMFLLSTFQALFYYSTPLFLTFKSLTLNFTTIVHLGILFHLKLTNDIFLLKYIIKYKTSN